MPLPYHLPMTRTGERRKVTRTNRKSPTLFMVLVALMMALVALTRDVRAEPAFVPSAADAQLQL